MKMQRVIQGSLGVLAATAVFGVAAQTATQPKSNINTSPAASSSTGAASGAAGQSGTSWNSNMNPGHDAQRSGGVNQMGHGTHQGDVRTSGSQGGENATRMPHPPTGTGATQVPGQPGSTWETPMNPGSGAQRGNGMNHSGDRMHQGGSSSGTSHGTTDRSHGQTRTSGSEGGENASRMPHPPTGTGAAIGVPGQPGSTMSSGGEGNRAGGARTQ
jgi:hypothetical protein